MQRKWMFYYVVLIAVFLIGRWMMISHFQFDIGKPSPEGKLWYLYWVNGFSILFLAPALIWSIRRLVQMVVSRTKSGFVRVFTLFYSIIILLFIFVIIYYSFILSF